MPRRIERLDSVPARLESIVLHFESAPLDETDGVRRSLGELGAQLTSLKSEYATVFVSPVAAQGLAESGSIDAF